MTEELRPCRLCHSSAVSQWANSTIVQCNSCGAAAPNYVWNNFFTSPDTVVLPRKMEEIKIWVERGLKNEDTDYRRKMFNQIIELTEQGK